MLHRRVSLVVRVYSHTLTSMRLHGSSHEARCLRFAQKTFTPHPRHAMSYTLQKPDTTHGHSFLAFPESVFQQSEQTCEEQRPQQSGALTELPPRTCCESNRHSQVSLVESKAMPQGAAPTFEVARPTGSAASSCEVARPKGSAASAFEARPQSWQWPGPGRRKRWVWGASERARE